MIDIDHYLQLFHDQTAQITRLDRRLDRVGWPRIDGHARAIVEDVAAGLDTQGPAVQRSTVLKGRVLYDEVPGTVGVLLFEGGQALLRAKRTAKGGRAAGDRRSRRVVEVRPPEVVAIAALAGDQYDLRTVWSAMKIK